MWPKKEDWMMCRYCFIIPHDVLTRFASDPTLSTQSRQSLLHTAQLSALFRAFRSDEITPIERIRASGSVSLIMVSSAGPAVASSEMSARIASMPRAGTIQRLLAAKGLFRRQLRAAPIDRR